MTLTPELLIAIAGFLTALVAIASQWRSAKTQAKKDEVQLLRDEVTRLQGRVETSEANYEKARRNNALLQDYIARLRSLMISAGIQVPEMPKLE